MKGIHRIYAIMAAFLLTVFLLSSGALAFNFDGTSSGSFINPMGPAGMLTTGVGTNSFTWGDGASFGSPPSSLLFTGGAFSGFFETEFSSAP